jgi:hypothetical protein
MNKTEDSVELENQELATVSGGASAPRRILPYTLEVTGTASVAARADLAKAVQSFQLRPVELPDFAVLMQLEYK